MADPAQLLNSISRRRASYAVGTIQAETEKDKFPASFPFADWNKMAQLYLEYWKWFDGSVLAEIKGRTKTGSPVMKFPLGINTIQNFAQKHAAFLLGEEVFDTPQPLVKTVVSSKMPLNGDNPSDEDKKNATLLQNIVNEVWTASKGRSLQVENATLQQFLGGCVFQLAWQPWRTDLLIPIVVKNIIPDFFYPIWSPDDPWDLLEAFIVYRLPAANANRLYNLNVSHSATVVYVEHWTKDSYSIYLDGKPLESDYSGIRTTYHDLENPFGFVPLVYIPHIRIGDFWGGSHVPALSGLVLEYNARMSDIGDATRKAVHRNRFVRNLQNNPQKITLADGVDAINLGMESPVAKHPPEVTSEDPPQMGEHYLNYVDKLWVQSMREGNLGGIAFGEDDGSQRSALTLAFRMYPSTSHARMERANWGDGIATLARFILRMVYVAQNDKHMSKLVPVELIGKVPEGFERLYQYAADWLPMIPRDREAVVNELVLRKQAGLISTRKALQDFGDVRNLEDELEAIHEDFEFAAQMAQQQSAEEGAQTKIQEPVASDGMKD